MKIGWNLDENSPKNKKYKFQKSQKKKWRLTQKNKILQISKNWKEEDVKTDLDNKCT